ncbi:MULTISPECIES: hypothetical protein [unclassified Clostridioides]
MNSKRINRLLSTVMATVIISLPLAITANAMEKTKSDNFER